MPNTPIITPHPDCPYDQSVIDRFTAKVSVQPGPDGCWLWDGYCNPSGYGKVWDGSRKEYAHRFAEKLMRGTIPDGMYVIHACRNKNCVSPFHIKTGTPKENSDDKLRDGTHQFGELNPAAILDTEFVGRIREQYAHGVTIDDLARIYGSNRANIHQIVTGKTWTSAPGPVGTSKNAAKGGQNGWSKLTESDVVEIRNQCEKGVSYIEVGRRFGVSGSCASRIARRKSWKHVP